MQPIIEFKDFTFRYRSQTEPTLHNINLAIYPGQKVLIAGPSGSGKSTLAHCINGLIPFSFTGESSGECRVNGKPAAEQSIFALSRTVGTVLQDTDSQFIGLTVAEDIAFALENDRVPQPEMHRRVAGAASAVALKPLLCHAPGALSGGQKQRVAMAGVLVSDVSVLLFDEPLANLDPATGKHAIALIDRLCRERKATVLIIEHRLEDVLYRDVDRIVVVGNGRIVADTSPDELLAGSVLEREGIREPLYLSALKYAGCTVTAQSRPQHVESMDLAAYAPRVRAWFTAAELPPRRPAAPPVLEVQNLCFHYNPGEPVLQNVSFTLHRGEMVSLVGKNGAGKSTLSGLICGFMPPTAGSILLDGQDIAPLSIKERGDHIGLVMQNPNQMISKPMIYDEVAMGLAARGVPEAETRERVYAALRTCGLYPMRNWPVSALSFGQKKRVTIAAILTLNPELIVLDEPTAGQDYRHYTEIMEFLKRLNEEKGVTILMITHDMHLMLEYTDRALVLADGTLLADSSPAAVLTNDHLVEKALLKRTSLYDLANRCGIPDASGFAERFIYCERTRRAAQKAEV
jgi:energy-coupling factor transport system ATP-binding protein